MDFHMNSSNVSMGIGNFILYSTWISSAWKWILQM